VELSQVIHDKINEELLDKEQNSYKKALQEHRTETFGDKAKEALKTALGAKAVQWYLRLPKTQRMALNFALGTSIGLAAGLGASVGAAGYVGFRAVRYGASFGGSTLGTAIGEKKKSWSLEDLDKKEKEETESMENSDKSWDEKSREFEEIKNRYEKERRNIKLKKAAVAVGFGAGSGILAGLSGHLTNVAEVVSTPKGGNIGGVKTGIAEHLENVKPKVSAEKLFENPENLKHIKVGGKVNSFWDTVKKGLDENERFKNFTEAQKQNAASFYANKGINNPGKYGLTPDSNFGVRVETGKEVDLSKLFANAEEMKKVLNGAAKKTLEEQKEILERSTKIAGWVKANPNGSLTEDKVSEILSSKPKTEISPESIMKNRIHEVLGDNPAPVEPPSPMPTHLEAQPEPPKAQFPSHFPDYRAGGGVVAAGMAPIIGTLDKKGQEQMHKEIRGEIDEAKSKLAKLEEKNEVKGVTNIRNPNLERSFASDSELTQEIDEAFKRGVDTIYGKSGFMGLGKTIGVNTKEWGEMARLPASKVVEYYTGDSTKSGLFPDPEDAKKLSESKNHNAFMRQTSDLINEANRLAIERGGVDVKFKPFDNGENMEQFIKRLAGYISKISSQNLIKAA
jgi:hypothetical protein